MATFSMEYVARVPAESGPPDLPVLGPLFGSFSLTQIVGQPAELEITGAVEALDEALKGRLRNLAEYPTEVRLYRDDTMIFAGPIVAGEVSGNDVTISARDLLYYLNYMAVDYGYGPSTQQVGKHIKAFIDNWASIEYGDFGLDTSDMDVGDNWTIFVPDTEPQYVHQIVDDMPGFDLSVDPETRKVLVHAPQKGEDLSDSVFLEVGIKSAESSFSVAPGIVATYVTLVGTAADDTPSVVTKSPVGGRAAFGAVALIDSVDGVNDEAALEGLADEYLNKRAVPFFSPGVELVPVVGAGWEDFEVGDTVTYSYDSGLGLVTGPYRVLSRTLDVDSSGTEAISVEFE